MGPSNTSLHVAFLKNRADVAEVILSCLDPVTFPFIDILNNNGSTPFMSGCIRGNYEVIEWFVHYTKMNPNCDEREIFNATASGGRAAIHFTSIANHTSLLKLLLSECGADVNSVTTNQRTALHYACQLGHSDTVSILLTSGANWKVVNNGGSSPFLLACENGYVDIVELFIDLFANVGIGSEEIRSYIDLATNNNRTALSFASDNGHEFIVEKLLALDASVNTQDTLGFTALYYAVREHHLNSIAMLLEKNADPHLASQVGISPVMYAKHEGHIEILQLLHSSLQRQQGLPLFFTKDGITVEGFQFIMFLMRRGAYVDVFGSNHERERWRWEDVFDENGSHCSEDADADVSAVDTSSRANTSGEPSLSGFVVCTRDAAQELAVEVARLSWQEFKNVVKQGDICQRDTLPHRCILQFLIV
jgi:ankyrin repeat protein